MSLDFELEGYHHSKDSLYRKSRKSLLSFYIQIT
jgi:hypothetical protein